MSAFRVDIAVPGLPVDCACFGQDSTGKLSDDHHMTFLNQPRTPCGGVDVFGAEYPACFAFKLDLLPASIDRVVVAVRAIRCCLV
ncbi:MAG: TerD family protein [Sulfuriferula multivorans]|uniref:TerD family protein n=1 Tax=Sulfuriferula multivorans TaxID=1559896 RepID=A0A7C9K8L0_9PROT|nr:TerD family protein [Sulfuriferula multivorans]